MKIQKACFFLTLFLVCCTAGLKPDDAASAVEAGDQTALLRLEGCGYQPLATEGFSYCRVMEGPVGQVGVTFIAPPQAKECQDHGPCVDFTIFFPTGEPAYQDSIPYGQTSKTISWKTLTKKDNFTAGDRGWWAYTYTIRWIDDAGNPRQTVSKGELRLRVYKPLLCDATGSNCRSDVPLRASQSNPNFVWSWEQEGQMIRMTTGARTYVGYSQH